jgi:hypothetical protein
MTKIINIQDYLLESDTPVLPKNMLKDYQDELGLENQQLLSHLMNLEGNLYNQSLVSATLKEQVKELQVENDILLKALEEDDTEELPVMLTDVIDHGSNQDVASQSIYWEREYSQLKDKIRHLEQLLSEKDDSLKVVTLENEQLLNEVLAK